MYPFHFVILLGEWQVRYMLLSLIEIVVLIVVAVIKIIHLLFCQYLLTYITVTFIITMQNNINKKSMLYFGL